MWVPVDLKTGHTELYFDRGRKGRMERGWYRFYTVMSWDAYGEVRVTARAKRWRSVGWRFDQLPRRQRFRFMTNKWAWIRSASIREVIGWLLTHYKEPHNDAIYAALDHDVQIQGHWRDRFPEISNRYYY